MGLKYGARELACNKFSKTSIRSQDSALKANVFKDASISFLYSYDEKVVDLFVLHARLLKCFQDTLNFSVLIQLVVSEK